MMPALDHLSAATERPIPQGIDFTNIRRTLQQNTTKAMSSMTGELSEIIFPLILFIHYIIHIVSLKNQGFWGFGEIGRAHV